MITQAAAAAAAEAEGAALGEAMAVKVGLDMLSYSGRNKG